MKTKWKKRPPDLATRYVVKFAWAWVRQTGNGNRETGFKERTIWLEQYISKQNYDGAFDCWDEINALPVTEENLSKVGKVYP